MRQDGASPSGQFKLCYSGPTGVCAYDCGLLGSESRARHLPPTRNTQAQPCCTPYAATRRQRVHGEGLTGDLKRRPLEHHRRRLHSASAGPSSTSNWFNPPD